MTAGEGIAFGVGALLLAGVVYLGATKLSGEDNSQAQAAAAQAAIAAERERLALQQLQVQQAARPQTQAGGVLEDILHAAPGLIDLGTKLFGGR